MQPITRSKAGKGTQGSERTFKLTILSTPRKSPLEATSAPRIATPCSTTCREIVLLTRTGRVIPGWRCRANTDPNCPALSWNYLENRVQNLFLQFLQVVERMHHAADLQQCGQVPAQAGCCR